MSSQIALLFDFGNVLIRVDFQRALEYWAQHSQRDIILLQQQFQLDHRHDDFEKGRIDTDTFLSHLNTTLELQLDFHTLLTGWNALLLEEIPGIHAILATYALHHPLYLFSNTNTAHATVWLQRHAALLKYFRRIFLSHQMGSRKPEAQAFEYVIEHIGLPPAQIIFFDDNAANIAGAKHCGINAHLVTQPTQILAVLQALTPPQASR